MFFFVVYRTIYEKLEFASLAYAWKKWLSVDQKHFKKYAVLHLMRGSLLVSDKIICEF